MASTVADHVKKIEVPAELKALLKEYPALRVDNKKGKVCCCLTGHEMPVREDAVRSFVRGKKFRKAQDQREYDFDQHKPHLVPNTKRRFEHTLFCTLTLRTVARRPVDVERHVNGKRYQRALKQWHKCQETGEKFKPRGGNAKRRRQDGLGEGDNSVSDSGAGRSRDSWQAGTDDGESVDDSDDDDLEDLYPDEDFSPSSGEEEPGDSRAENDGDKEEEAELGDADYHTAHASRKGANGQAAAHKAVKRKNKSPKPGGKKKRM